VISKIQNHVDESSAPQVQGGQRRAKCWCEQIFEVVFYGLALYNALKASNSFTGFMQMGGIKKVKLILTTF